MRRLWNGCRIAFAMFSRIPVPTAQWTEENMAYMLCFFPLVGLVTGLLSMGVYLLCRRAGIADGFAGVLLTAMPVLVTGGIHLDGFMDTVDARRSYKGRSERLAILKDPHTGAFAVIALGIYLLLQAGAFCQLYTCPEAMRIVCGGYILSRCFSGLGVLRLPKASEEGTVASFSRNSRTGTVTAVLTVVLLLTGAWMIRRDPLQGGLVILAHAAVFVWYRRMALREFGGTTGDLSGYCLCIAELAGLLAAAFGSVLPV